VTEAAEKKGAQAKELILGFDAECGTCSDLAQRIQERVGSKLAVRNLRDPEVEGWREEALGKAAPWAPTLFEVEPGGKVRAWVGISMGLALSRKLGAKDTWRVMQALGEMGQAARIEESAVVSRLPEKAQEAVAGISRGQFLKGMGGATVAATVLAGGPLAVSAQAVTKSPYDIVKSRRLTGTELTRAAQQVGQSIDVKNVLGLALSTPTKVKAAKPVAAIHTLRNGTAQRVVVYQLVGDRVLTHVQFSVPPKGKAASRAMLWRAESRRWVMTKASEGGELWRVDARSRSTARDSISSRSALEDCESVSGPPQNDGCWIKSSKCVAWSQSQTCGLARGAEYPLYFTCLGSLATFNAGAAGGFCYSWATAHATVEDCCVQRCDVWIRMNGYMGC
jgi:hypothetical protein